MSTGSTATASERSLDLVWTVRVRRYRGGWLAGLAAVIPASSWLTSQPDHPLQLACLASSSVITAAAALRQGRGRSIAWYLGVAVVLAALGAGQGWLRTPLWSFLLASVAISMAFWRRAPTRNGGLDRVPPELLSTWGAVLPALFMAGILALRPQAPGIVYVSAYASAGLSAALGVRSVLSSEGPYPALLAQLAILLALPWSDPSLAPLGLCFIAGVPIAASAIRQPSTLPFAPVLQSVGGRPELLLSSTFGTAIAVGGFVLALPLSASSEQISLLDAFFTAVSAVCVTGLSVVDVGLDLSGFGQFVLLFLIQIGGLGIMTFSTAALAVLRSRPSLRHERALSDIFVSWEGLDPIHAVRNILLITLSIEALGAVMMATWLWSNGMKFHLALWQGLFTSVSAFCNAGFSLYSDSLMRFETEPVMLLITASIIILGSLGPFLILSVLKDQSGFGKRLQGNRVVVRLMGQTSLVLLLAGAGLFAAMEWDGVLQPLGWPDRVVHAVFQSASLRTAGFNAVDMSSLAPATVAMMLLFMFVGGCPGSTAGGMKTTTFAVIVLSVSSAVRARAETSFGGRRLSHETFYRSVAIIVLGALAVLALWISLLLTQGVPALGALFEAVSALGTVGLSVGVTSQLDEVGKVLISIGMFIGRLGPVTVLFLFSAQHRKQRSRLAELSIPVG